MAMTSTHTFEEVLYRALEFARSRAQREPWEEAWLVGLEPLGLNWRG